MALATFLKSNISLSGRNFRIFLTRRKIANPTFKLASSSSSTIHRAPSLPQSAILWIKHALCIQATLFLNPKKCPQNCSPIRADALTRFLFVFLFSYLTFVFLNTFFPLSQMPRATRHSPDTNTVTQSFGKAEDFPRPWNTLTPRMEGEGGMGNISLDT